MKRTVIQSATTYLFTIIIYCTPAFSNPAINILESSPKDLFYKSRSQNIKKSVLKISVNHHKKNPSTDRMQKRQMPLSEAVITRFYTGDEITFTVTYNRNGFLYVLHRGASGKLQVLFPRHEEGEKNNRLHKHKPFLFPKRGTFTFSPPRGIEYLSFVVTSKQLLLRDIMESAKHGFPPEAPKVKPFAPPRMEVSVGSPNSPKPQPQIINNQPVQITQHDEFHDFLANSKRLCSIDATGKLPASCRDLRYTKTADYLALPNQDRSPNAKQDLRVRSSKLDFIPFFLTHY